MKSELLILVAVLSVSIMGCGKSQAPAPAPIAMSTPQSGWALQSCVLSNHCDDDTNRMLHRAGSILGISAYTLQRDLHDAILRISQDDTNLSAIGITKAGSDVARASGDGLFPYLDGQLRKFIEYCDKGGTDGCKNSGPLRPL